jgi:hypothetical protein
MRQPLGNASTASVDLMLRPNLIVVTPPLFDAHLRFDAIAKPVQAETLVA